MPLDLKHPANRGVLRYLNRLTKKEWAGVHTDILDRIIALARKVPGCTRRSLRGARLILHRKSGIIVAVAFGTAYAVRVGAAVKEAKRAGLQTTEEFMDGGKLDVQREFGPDWLFGGWEAKEPAWMAMYLSS